MANKIDKRFVHYVTEKAFENAKTLGIIDENSIVFIQDAQKVWTHGAFYAGKGFTAVTAGDTTIKAAGIDDIITFLSGEGLEISVDTEPSSKDFGSVTYSHKKTVAPSNIQSTAGKYIDSITFDQFGHVASVNVVERKVVITDSATGKENASSALSNESVKINIVDGETVTKSIGVKGEKGIGVTYDGNGNILVGHSTLKGSQEAPSVPGSIPSGSDTVSVVSNVLVDENYHIVSLGKIDLPTKSYVDKMISNSGGSGSGMTLKGVLGTGVGMTPSLPETAEAGDTWRVGTSGVYGEYTCGVGDMLICTSSNPLEWSHLPNTQEIASTTTAGVVKGGFPLDIAGRNFPVQIQEDGTMFVNVPYSDALSSKNIISDSATGISEVTGKIENGNVKLNHVENDKIVSSHSIIGTGATTVTSESGEIKINSANAKYEFNVVETAAKKSLVISGADENDYSYEVTLPFDEWFEGD